MRSIPRGRFTGLILLAAVLIAAAVIAGITTRPQGATQQIDRHPTYDVHSSSPQGTRALSMWLSDLGYTTSTLEYQPFRVDSQDGLLFILFPSLELTDTQTAAIIDWVRGGGTLIIADVQEHYLLRQLGLFIIPRKATSTAAHPVEPSLNTPSVSPATINTYATLGWLDANWIPTVNDLSTGQVLGATRPLGQGSIFAFTTGDIFSNKGLTSVGNRDLTLNILQRVPVGSTVVIDEYHHGYTEQGTFTRQLFSQPWGQAIIFVAALLFAFIALTGRRFGAAIRPIARASKRARADFARTLASLLQQRDQRDWLRDHYVYQLKRSLAARFRVRSNLPADEFVQQLSHYNADAAALASPLAELEAARPPSDSRMIVLMREADQIVVRLLEPRTLAAATPRDIDPTEPARKTG